MEFNPDVVYLFVMPGDEFLAQGKVVEQKSSTVELDNGDVVNLLHCDWSIKLDVN